MVAVDWSCAADGAAEVTMRQSRGLPLGSAGDPARRWSIPICLAYPDAGGRRSQCLLLQQPEQTVRLPTAACPAWILPNEDGAAYLNIALPDRGWAGLIGAVDALRPSEMLSAVASVGAAYEAGTVGTARVLELAQAAANSPHWDVVAERLRDIKNFVVPVDRQPAMRAAMRRIYGPALARFDLSDAALAAEERTAERALLRGDLLWFMALDADDAELRGRLRV